MKSITVVDAVAILNRALEADPDAISQLVCHHVPCNQALADDPTIQGGYHDDDTTRWHEVGMLGILNGLFGVRANQCGYLIAEVNGAENMVLRFYAVDDDGQEIK